MTVEALAPHSGSGTARTDGIGRRQVHAVAACYFVASFAALGLPPYLTAILPALGDPQGRWAGVLHIVPTVFSGLGAPLWGRLADRFGRKRLSLAQERLPGVSGATTGLLFALPHLCYLAFAARTHTAFLTRPHTGIALGFVALGLAGHAAAHSPAAFVAVRLLLGAGLTLGLICLSVLAAEAVHGRAPGRMFGTLEFISKGGAVAAGAVATLANGRFGAASPVLAGTAAALLAAVAAALLAVPSRKRWSHR